MKDLLEFLIESVAKGNRKYQYKGATISGLAESMDFNQFHEFLKDYSGLEDLKPSRAKKLLELCKKPMHYNNPSNFKEFSGCMYFDKEDNIAFCVVADHLITLFYDNYKFFESGNIDDLNDLDKYINMNNDQILRFLSDHTELQYLF